MRLYRGPCPAWVGGGPTSGGTPVDGVNGATGRGYGCLFVAKKELEITRLVIANRHTADALVLIAISGSGSSYTASALDNNRLTPDAGTAVLAGTTMEWETVLTVAGAEGFNMVTNIALLGVSALTLDISGRAI
jgi:hypothetical protein